MSSQTPSTIPAAARQTASKLVFRLEGCLPRTGGRLTLETDPTPLTRENLRAARDQLTEALEASMRYRIASPKLTLLTEAGTVLRITDLIETPERDRYLAAEGEPGAGAAETDEWFVRCVTAFGRKRTL